jgi:hypothetical protein
MQGKLFSERRSHADAVQEKPGAAGSEIFQVERQTLTAKPETWVAEDDAAGRPGWLAFGQGPPGW